MTHQCLRRCLLDLARPGFRVDLGDPLDLRDHLPRGDQAHHADLLLPFFPVLPGYRWDLVYRKDRVFLKIKIKPNHYNTVFSGGHFFTLQKSKVLKFMIDYESCVGVPMILPLKCKTSGIWHIFFILKFRGPKIVQKRVLGCIIWNYTNRVVKYRFLHCTYLRSTYLKFNLG